LAVAKGIIVEDTLASISDNRVYAIGNCIEHRGHVSGLVSPAWEQADVLADRLSGRDRAATYTGSSLVTRLTAGEIDIAIFGEALASDDDTHVIKILNQAQNSYRKVVIRDGRVVGGILVGELSTVGDLTLVYTRGDEIPSDKLHLIVQDYKGGFS